MDLELSGKTAIVTGASRGIGLEVVRSLTAEGVAVLGAARTISQELSSVARATLAVDLSRSESASALVEHAVEKLGGIDLLVNNAGGVDPGELAGFARQDDAFWLRVFELNFFAAVRVTRAALPQLAERRGRVVNVSSIGAWEPSGMSLAYDTAKAALKALGRGLAKELGPQGIRIATVSPGPTRTSIWNAPDGPGAKLASAVGVPHAEFIAQVPSRMGMVTGRMVEPAEVAELITFLLSERAASMTGSDHLIDGGAIRGA
jgi:NAD(P)-dependent dehydrogenase (short-subunit alcohol dehydrogenase family)